MPMELSFNFLSRRLLATKEFRKQNVDANNSQSNLLPSSMTFHRAHYIITLLRGQYLEMVNPFGTVHRIN